MLAAKDGDELDKAAWLEAKHAEAQAGPDAWLEQYRMPPLEGRERAIAWGVRCRHPSARTLPATTDSTSRVTAPDYHPSPAGPNPRFCGSSLPDGPTTRAPVRYSPSR